MLKLFEVALPGFNGGTDETDDLIKWVIADSIEQVQEFYKGAEVYQMDDDFTYAVIVLEMGASVDADLRAIKE